MATTALTGVNAKQPYILLATTSEEIYKLDTNRLYTLYHCGILSDGNSTTTIVHITTDGSSVSTTITAGQGKAPLSPDRAYSLPEGTAELRVKHGGSGSIVCCLFSAAQKIP